MRRLLLGGVLAIGLGVGLLTLTERGFALLSSLLDLALPGSLSVHAEGTFLGGWQLRDLHYRDGALDLRIARLILDWQPLALLEGRLTFRYLGAHDVQLTMLGDDDAGAPDFPPTLGLPVAIDVQRAVLEDLRLHEGDGPPRSLEKLVLTARAEADRVQFTLTAEVEDSRLKVSGKLGLDEGWPMDSELWWRTVVAGLSLRGEGELRGRYDRGWQWHQALSGALQGDMDGELRLVPVLAWTLAGQLTADPTHLDTPWPAQNLRLEVQSSGTLADFRVDGEAAAEVSTLGRVTGQFQFRRQGLEWRLEKLALDSSEAPLQLSASGVVDPATGTVKARGRWQALGWPLADPTVSSPSGQFRLTGNPRDYHFGLHSDWWHKTLGEGSLRVTGQGSEEQLEVSSLRLTRIQAESEWLTANGSLRFADRYFQVWGQWQGLRWPVQDNPTFTGGQGRLQLDGRLPIEGIGAVFTAFP